MTSNNNNNNNNMHLDIDFYYISAWEKHATNGCSSQIFRGDEGNILEFSVNTDFFAHASKTKEDFDVSLQLMFELLKVSEINTDGTLEAFWKFANSLAKKTLWIYPDWENYIGQRLKTFDEEHCVPFFQMMEMKK